MIRIGQEIAIEPLEDCSFVTTTCETKDRTLGHISVVGPKRMDYNNVISHIGLCAERYINISPQMKSKAAERFIKDRN